MGGVWSFLCILCKAASTARKRDSNGSRYSLGGPFLEATLEKLQSTAAF